MPNYEYRCKSCSYEFEEFQKITDPALVNCPECKTDNLVRLIHGGAGLHFKGSGFYLTDYKKSNTSGSSSETKPVTESGTKTETKKAETKTPETKSTKTSDE